MPSTRNRAWADQRIAGTSLAVANRLVFDLLANAPTVDTLTAIRIVGDLVCQYSPNTSVVDLLSVVDVGIGVSSVEAFALADTALPKPSAETEYPPRGWLYIATKPVARSLDTEGVLETVATFSFDICSMRKIDKGRLFIMIENSTVLTGSSIRITGRIRVLCLT